MELRCGDALCKQPVELGSEPEWPVRCSSCGVLLYPLDVLRSKHPSELEPHRTVLKRVEHGRLCDCTTADLAANRAKTSRPARADARAAKRAPVDVFALADVKEEDAAPRHRAPSADYERDSAIGTGPSVLALWINTSIGPSSPVAIPAIRAAASRSPTLASTEHHERYAHQLGCSSCLAVVPLAKGHVRWCVGLIVWHLYGASSGWFCRNCLETKVAKALVLTASLGWWGLVSAFLTPIALIMNYLTLRNAIYELRSSTGAPLHAPVTHSAPRSNGCPRCGTHSDLVIAAGRGRCNRCGERFAA